jgi:hypothetical protein
MKYRFCRYGYADPGREKDKQVGILKRGSRFGANVTIMPGVNIGRECGDPAPVHRCETMCPTARCGMETRPASSRSRSKCIHEFLDGIGKTILKRCGGRR